MDKTVFWDIFTHHLEAVAAKTEHDMQQSSGANNPQQTKAFPVATDEPQLPEDVSELFTQCHEEDVKSVDRPDAWNFRVLMWRAMGSFADRAEGRSRQLVPLLFTFME